MLGFAVLGVILFVLFFVCVCGQIVLRRQDKHTFFSMKIKIDKICECKLKVEN